VAVSLSVCRLLDAYPALDLRKSATPFWVSTNPWVSQADGPPNPASAGNTPVQAGLFEAADEI